ncbi:MAG: histidine kinase dimerization/phospho-acceptor domain-containing protein [Candidatus Lokiarchaeota archaeon]
MNKELEEKVRDRTKELIKQNKKLKQLDKLKNDFISMAAHELKTPLISIGGYIDLILIREKENLNSEIKSDLHRAISNVKRLQQYINQLMDVMKIDAERMELDKSIY